MTSSSFHQADELASSQTTPPTTSPVDKAARRRESQRRQSWILLFALMLVLVAGACQAQSPITSPAPIASPAPITSPAPIASQPKPSRDCGYCASQGCLHGAAPRQGCRCTDCHVYLSSGTTHCVASSSPGMLRPADHVSVIDRAPVEVTRGGAVPLKRLTSKPRPVYAELVAGLANFDADAEPDGWRAEVALFDKHDQPVAMRAYATFELMPRMAAADDQQYVDAQTYPIRWSKPLEFDEQGVATVRLPLRSSLRPVLGWPSAFHGSRSPRSSSHETRQSSSWRPRLHSSHRSFVTQQLRDRILTPSVAELRVRVSVPTEGVFKAVSIVPLRPSVLVDTPWPYR